MELHDHIERLLERYFEAVTSVAEEKELKNYFAQEAVAPHLEQYRPLFNYFSIAKTEQFTKQVPLKSKKKLNYGWISIAASVAVVLGIYFGSQKYISVKEQERKEAEYAYIETKKALDLLAKNLGKGTQKMAYLNEFEVAKSKVFNKTKKQK